MVNFATEKCKLQCLDEPIVSVILHGKGGETLNLLLFADPFAVVESALNLLGSKAKQVVNNLKSN